MQRTLVDRFRGVLLGAVVGNCLGTQFQGKSYQERRWQQQTWSSINDQHGSMHPVLSLMLGGANCLVHHGCWVTPDGHLWQQKGLGDRSASLTDVEIAIAVLPIMLFFHEENTKLQQQLQQAFAILKGSLIQDAWQKDSGWVPIQVIGEAIADMLREQFDPNTAIVQTLRQLQTVETPWFNQLRQIQTLLETKASLESVRMHFLKSSDAISQGSTITSALYSFLATPRDFYLSLLRAALLDEQPDLTCTLVGALSGGYNGWSGIPVGWRVGTKPLKSLSEQFDSDFFSENQLLPLLSHPKKPLTSEIVQLADYLLATWSGVFAPGKFTAVSHQVSAIAAPRVIRPQANS
jgi:ADP-ribosylglycohydrolase